MKRYSTLSSAIRKYGIDTFAKETIVEVPNDLLDYYETKFIDLYDAVKSGYNSLSTGHGVTFEASIKERRAAALKKVWEDPEQRKAREASIAASNDFRLSQLRKSYPKTIKKRAESNKKKWLDPEHRAWRSSINVEINSRPETQEKRLAAYHKTIAKRRAEKPDTAWSRRKAREEELEAQRRLQNPACDDGRETLDERRARIREKQRLHAIAKRAEKKEAAARAAMA